MDETEAKQLSIELMEIAEAALLTTIDGNGFPYTRGMLNLRRTEQFPGLIEMFKEHRSDFLVYFTTNTSSVKMDQIRGNPGVSVYYCKPDEWRGLMLGGIIEVVTDPGVKETIWQKGWELYYPGGANDPDYTILRLLPRFARYYHQLNFTQFNLKKV
ncbi:MAG: pyridoxamine 5'-phosphate oxidase family protein [Spirochaetes bacterium]|nr:pyridoxamine 5'-phosphate oxidase family protein [Spirochaetota bacterium]